MRVNLTVNGRPHTADDVWEGESLLYVLRERLGLPGSKNACEQGECGSCTVRLDGDLVCACLVAAGQAEGREVTTVEGLAQGGEGDGGDRLAPIQRAFVEAGAVQCGFCTPGLLMAADDLLARVPDPADADIREALSGNLCRCTGYETILDAVRLAATRTGGAGTPEAPEAPEGGGRPCASPGRPRGSPSAATGPAGPAGPVGSASPCRAPTAC